MANDNDKKSIDLTLTPDDQPEAAPAPQKEVEDLTDKDLDTTGVEIHTDESSAEVTAVEADYGAEQIQILEGLEAPFDQRSDLRCHDPVWASGNFGGSDAVEILGVEVADDPHPVPELVPDRLLVFRVPRGWSLTHRAAPIRPAAPSHLPT